MQHTPTLDGLSDVTSGKWTETMIRPGEGAVFLVSSPDAHLLDRMASASAIQTAIRMSRKVVLLRQGDTEAETDTAEPFAETVARLVANDESCVVALPEVSDASGFRAACTLAAAGCTVVAGFVARNTNATLRRLVTPQTREADLRLVRGALAVRTLPRADSPSTILVSEARVYDDPFQILVDAKSAEETSGDIGFVTEALRLVDRGLVTMKCLEDRFVSSDIEDARREMHAD